MIYSTPKYQKLKKQIEKKSKEMEKLESSSSANIKKTQRKQKNVEDELKLYARDMSMLRFKSMIFVSLTMISLLAIMNASYDGIPVALLPFTPFGFIEKLSHRNIPGDNLRECSAVFFYVICSFGIKNNIQKLCGFTPPQSYLDKQNPWGLPQDEDLQKWSR
jgi:uncharacterized membrane protein (DUF106 family)